VSQKAIGSQRFIYDKQYLTHEDINKQVTYWEDTLA
jgi:hypothetical protein